MTLLVSLCVALFFWCLALGLYLKSLSKRLGELQIQIYALLDDLESYSNIEESIKIDREIDNARSLRIERLVAGLEERS